MKRFQKFVKFQRGLRLVSHTKKTHSRKWKFFDNLSTYTDQVQETIDLKCICNTIIVVHIEKAYKPTQCV